MTELKCMTDFELKQWRQNGKVPDELMIIDIREPSEYRQEHIPGSKNIPLSELRQTDFSTEKHKTALFHCRSGYRTKNAAAQLLACGFKESYCLPEGIAQWKRCDLPVVRDSSAPIDIMRQVQILSGSLILTGLILSYFIHPYFLLLSSLAGAALISQVLKQFAPRQNCFACPGKKYQMEKK